MLYYSIKVIVTVVLVILVSEIAKKSTLLGAIFASIPLISVLAMTWLYLETKDVEQVTNLAKSIVWLVIPSLSLFILLPVCIERGLSFYMSMGIGLVVTALLYCLIIAVTTRA